MMASPGITEDNLMRVSATSPPQMVANSIFKSIFEQSTMPIVRAIGAGAVAQTCKAIAIVRGMSAVRGIDLGCNIGFDTVEGDSGKEISAQTFRLYSR
jgi:stage V sporulation protein S